MYHNENPSLMEYRISCGDWQYYQSVNLIVMTMQHVMEVARRQGWESVAVQARRQNDCKPWDQVPGDIIPVDILNLILLCRMEVPV